MFSLYIGSTKRWIRDVSGSLFKVFPVFYKKDGEVLELRLSTELPPLDDVEIHFWWWRYLVRIPVSARLRTAILNFMLFKHLVQNDSFGCYSFACEYAQVPQHDKHDLLSHWSLRPLRWWRPRIGDVVFLFSRPTKDALYFHHASVYLGFGRYLSVWGKGGQFEVATLADMKRDFGAKKIYVAIPR